jgi:thiopurine S-methyltransferase
LPQDINIVNEEQNSNKLARDGINRHWLQRWEDGNTGWHHQEINPHLLGFWHALGVPAGCRVLVPLCGKSRDMVWLAEQGHSVTGVELSPLAVAAFFDEQGLRPERRGDGELEAWQAGPYRILCGDIFSLQPGHVSGVQAVYDRASVVALDPQQRRDYAALLGHLLPVDCRVLLVAMDYPQQEMPGPPYSVDEAEVMRLFGEAFRIERLDALDLLRDSQRYVERGLSRLWENIYRLVRR